MSRIFLCGMTSKEYDNNAKAKNVRELPLKEEILSKFIYIKEEGKLKNKKTLKETIPDAKGYKVCYYGKDGHKQIRYKVHRLIYFLETGEQPEEIDHIDGNRLNNHISNLRAATSKQNMANSRGNENATSKYKGVGVDNRCPLRPWRAYVKHGDKSHYLGQFKEEKDAARAYNEKAFELNGEFAYLNKIEED